METCLMSQLLFQYLSRIFGSEKVVRARRLYYGVEDCIKVSWRFRKVNSGSKAEGLNFPGSDLDIMYIWLETEVYQDVTSCPQNVFPSLYISTDDTAPGFVQINVRINIHGGSHFKSPTFISCGKANRIILPNSRFKDIFQFFGESDFNGLLSLFLMKPHGPCQSTIDDSVDYMFSFQLHSWPNVASGWILRPRLFDWPPSSIMSNIVQERVLLVPIGSKFGSLADNPNEWRISFSLAEKLLVHSFNHTQLMCYVLLKILLKEILNKNMVTKNVLCSYFMKTILFWIIEETGSSVWTPNNLVKCFRACITKLSYLLKQKYLPNYFIPENNMIEGKLSEDSLSNFYTLLHLVNHEGVGFTRRTDTLQDFLLTIHRNSTTIYQADEAFNALCSLLKSRKSIRDVELRGNLFCMNIFKTKLIRYLFYYRFLNHMSLFPFQNKYDFNSSNKSLYCNYKSSLGYTVIGAKLDLLSWLYVAIIFYCHKNYNNTLKITDFIQSENLLMKNFAFDYEKTIEERFSIWQKLKLRYCTSLAGAVHECTAESMIAKSDLLLCPLGFPLEIVILSHSLLRFVRFLCYHHLKNVSKRTKAVLELFEMFEEITNEDFSIDEQVIGGVQLFKLLKIACNMSHMRIPDNILIKKDNWLLQRCVPYVHDCFYSIVPLMIELNIIRTK